VLTVAYLRGKRLTVYDPTDTRDKHTNLLEALREYLRVEADREKNVEILESIDSWRLEICTDAPRQKNAVDRGVFICMYADCISAREPLDFDAADMNTCRDRIAHTIIREFGTQGGAREGRGRAENAAADEQHGADETAWDTRCRQEAAALLCEMGIRLPENDGGAVQAAAAVGEEKRIFFKVEISDFYFKNAISPFFFLRFVKKRLSSTMFLLLFPCSFSRGVHDYSSTF